jgi:hypothetical protein
MTELKLNQIVRDKINVQRNIWTGIREEFNRLEPDVRLSTEEIRKEIDDYCNAIGSGQTGFLLRILFSYLPYYSEKYYAGAVAERITAIIEDLSRFTDFFDKHIPESYLRTV